MAGTAIVTGGSGGIGLAVVEHLGRQGMRVAVADLKPPSPEAEGRLRAAGVDLMSVRCDVSSSQQVDAMVGQVCDRWGRVDVLVNNAGIDLPSALWELTDGDWAGVLAVNLSGAFYATRAAVNASMRAHGGAIVNVSSHAGLRGTRNRANYAASKAALIGLTKASALELGQFGVRVNAVAPGVVETAMTEGLRNDPAQRERFAGEVLLGRFGTPADVAAAVAFLAGDAASWITGKVLGVDGGAYN